MTLRQTAAAQVQCGLTSYEGRALTKWRLDRHKIRACGERSQCDRATLPEQRAGLRAFIVVAAMWLTIGSLQARPGSADADDAFYVGSHGWHTSIIVPRAKVSADAWPQGVASKTFARYDWLEIGWGDRKFYTASKPDVGMALDAVFSPGPSVLHIVGLDSPISRALAWSGLVRVPCTTREMTSLCRALGDSFDRDARGDAVALGSGLYGATSRFYRARGRYYLFNTCDTWTARMMRAGGLRANTSPAGTWSAGAVMAQARRLAARRQGARP